MQICMDWRRVHFDWNRARAFLVSAQEGSLSAASRALGVSQPTLGRQVSALEKELDTILFERVGQGLRLTPSGLRLLEYVRSMGEAAEKLALTASGHAQTLEGSICITAGEAISAVLLPPILAKLRQEQPGIQVELVASNATLDLRRREADIAIRNYRPTQNNLVAKKIRDVPGQLYASPEYLKKLGPISQASDLCRADFIGFDHSDALRDVLATMGVDLRPDNFPLLTANHLVQWEWVKQGLGIGVMQADIGDREPLVQRIDVDGLTPITVPMWLTVHQEVHTSRRVRIVFDTLDRELRTNG